MCSMCPVYVALRMGQTAPVAVTAVGFEPMHLRTGTWSQRLRPLGQTVRWHHMMAICKRDTVYHNVWFACGVQHGYLVVCHDRCQASMGVSLCHVCGVHMHARLIVVGVGTDA